MPVVGKVAGLAHLVGHFGKALFDGVDRGRQPLRFGQAEQSERAIGLDLDHALRQRARAVGSEAAVDHENAHEAGRIGLKVGGVDRGAVAVFRKREAGAVK